ncbi:MAG: hypothetical protein ABI862_02655 [Ilumatobacteraceae bacterium]
MAIDEVVGQAWTRKHDDPALPVVPSAPRTVYPRSLEELIELCGTRKPTEKLHAAGSHWALSSAAISDSIFIETHDPNNKHQAMGRTLYDVVGRNGCLEQAFIDALAKTRILPFDSDPVNISNVGNEGLYPIHFETGKRIYQLYSELDAGDDDPDSLAVDLDRNGNSTYLGPWAFKTLGGAGGQTVFGALTTGTHGGDFLIAPIADSVLALHLVVDGGKHYWIEPESSPPLGVPLTDRTRLEALYGQPRYGGPENFEVVRDDNLFNAVLIAAGRFGIVYSIVIAAVRQYCLHHERRLTTWQDIKGQVNDPTSALYTGHNQAGLPASPNKYLNIVVSVTPFENFTKNLAGVTKAWNAALVATPGTSEPAGRPERRGIRGPFDNQIQAPLFQFAGNSSTYRPDPKNPGMTLSPDALSLACTNADFMGGVLDLVQKEIDVFVKTNGATVGTTIAVVIAVSGAVTAGAALAILLVALLAILPILAALLLLIAALPRPLRLGHVMNLIQTTLLNSAFPPGSPERLGGLVAWQAIANEVFSGQQKAIDAEAISYAAMDGKDYLEKSCSANADSIEVFFDATDPMLIAYVDGLLAYEIAQEHDPLMPRAFVGYISLRFTGQTSALIGQQRFPLTCAVEVSGVRDVAGVTAFMDFAIMLALDGNFQGILHWGQRNESLRAHVQERFGDTAVDQTGNLRKWRDALARITEHGKLDGFSNAFTRQTGLELCNPTIGDLHAVGTGQLQPISIDWDCDRNPPATEIGVEVTDPNGMQSWFSGLPLVGQQQVIATQSGVYSVSLIAAVDIAGERREARQQVDVLIA